MPSANIETDPFFVLLTDALRTGPGSPQWNEAIAALRQQGLEAADEHRMLIEARANLEAGREYRSVRAGAGFTRKVMEEIEQGPAGNGRNGLPTATLVAIVCGLLILSGVGYLVWRMSPREANLPAMVSDLEIKSQGFVDKVAGAAFAGSIPDGWHAIGSLKLDPTDGLRPALSSDQVNKNPGGGVVINNPLPAGQSFAVDVTLGAAGSTSAMLLEVFVSTDANFSPDKGTSSRDLIWQLSGTEQRILVNGSVVKGGIQYNRGDAIRLIVGPDVGIIEYVPAGGGSGRPLWAGRHDLGSGARYVGVRFLQTGAGPKQDVSVQSIKLTTSPGT